MWYKVFVPGPLLLIPVLIMTTKGTQTKNDTSIPSSDVIVKYSAHAEAADLPILIVTERSTESTFISTAKYYYSTPEKEIPKKESSDVEDMEEAVENIQDDTADLHGVSQPVVSKICKRVAGALAKISHQYVAMPVTLQQQEDNMRKFRSLANFPTVIGAIDCTHIRVKKINADGGQLFINRKGFPSINVQSPHEDVVFVPNEREVERNDDYLQHNNYNLNDMMAGQKTVGDVLAAKNIKLATEAPISTDIIFVMGKNIENADEATTPKSQRYAYIDESIYPDQQKTKPTKPPRLDCTNLFCNNNIKSVCGGKVENNHWRFRLFLNDCYFRKVNCNFRSAINRYKEVPLDNCNNVVHHTMDRPFSFRPEPKLKPVQVNNTRRSTSSRRSMAMNTDGQFCAHPCPTSCPEDYAPECAVSPTGRRRVFVNHCALDYNSCSFGVVWHKRPLAECVGGKMADMRQNAGFIGWMQRVGIVDKRGRLVLE